VSKYDNSGILFVNRDKKTDKHPAYTGKITINGEERRLAGWIKKDETTGQFKYMTLKISDQQRQGLPQREEPKQRQLDDEIPF
jgi:hypothetical protein